MLKIRQRPRQDRIRLIVLTGLAVFVVIAVLTAYSFFTVLGIEELRNIVADFLLLARDTHWAYPLICIIYILSGAVLFPIMALNLATALVFGPIYGSFYALSGIILNTCVYFHVGRLGRSHISRDRFNGRKFKFINDTLQKAGVSGIAIMRLIPLAPFSVVNIAAGLTLVSFPVFLTATCLATLPGLITRAVLGDSLMQMFMKPSLENFLYLGCGLLLWIGMILSAHILFKKHHRHE